MPLMIIYLFIFPGFSDWEPAFVTPELNEGTYKVITVGMTREPVKTMGGLTVVPDLTIDEIRYEAGRVFILPGGTGWNDVDSDKLNPVINKFIKHEIPVAGICAASTYLAAYGYLNNCKHTGNSREEMIECSDKYTGKDNFLNKPAVYDSGFITANGTAYLEFAVEIFKAIGHMNDDEAAEWLEFWDNPEIDK